MALRIGWRRHGGGCIVMRQPGYRLFYRRNGHPSAKRRLKWLRLAAWLAGGVAAICGEMAMKMNGKWQCKAIMAWRLEKQWLAYHQWRNIGVNAIS